MAAPPVFLHHPSSLEHDTRPHPEQPARIPAVLDELERRGWLGWSVAESSPVDLAVLERIHSAAYVEVIRRAAASGGGALDVDTVISSGSFRAALHAAGGAVEMVERLVSEGAGARGFSAHRPPGHHALPARAMGFCLFNNIAVAARHAVEGLGLSRVLILDWDVHHGNGTHDVFWADPSVLFVSIHEWPLYPGTGRARDLGEGAGRGFTVNLPVPAGTGDPVYVSLVRDVVVPLARSFSPELVLISAGYDAHREDPLADCRVTDEGFAAMASLVSSVCDELGVACGCVLEGGYALDALARSVAATMAALVPGRGEDVVAPAERDPLAVQAVERLEEFWPGLAGGA